MTPYEQEKLEHVIHETLRALPPRSAPPALESRVLAAIERRRALPWWKTSFNHWPLPARVAFFLASAGIVKLVLLALVWAMAGFEAARFHEALGPHFAMLEAVITVMRALGDLVATTLRAIPPVWLYGAAAIFAALYVTLFGLGAAAYRTLYVNR
jgi:hypothetical protein